MRKLEEQAKALAPVFSRLLEKAVSDMKEELVKRDHRIDELEKIEPVEFDYEVAAKKAADLIPLPKDGLNGEDGTSGADGKDGLPGADGKDGHNGIDGANGKDGASVSEDAVKDAIAASFERRFSDMQLSWERQARDAFEKAIDRIPAPKDGVDGIDALPLEDIEILQDGRNVTLKLGKVERTIKLDTIIDKGVWREGDFDKGDAVSYGGSLWIAQKELPSGAPGTNKGEWRLAVKKGRDGKNLRDNTSTKDGNESIKL